MAQTDDELVRRSDARLGLGDCVHCGSSQLWISDGHPSVHRGEDFPKAALDSSAPLLSLHKFTC